MILPTIHRVLFYELFILVIKEKWEAAAATGDVGRVGKPRLMEVWAGRRNSVGRVWARHG